jgi:SAM-dependent methyltransferase
MTGSWTAGYVADIGYTFGYYTELNPLRAQLAFLHAGLEWSETSTACELGFGQGLSVNIHAAGSTSQWYGTDFNPSQAGFAQELAKSSGANAYLSDESFAEFCARDDLPEFDYIGIHGIWSWISDENRAVIVDFIRRKLRAGGVLYISYNTLPGWSAAAPLRHLMTQHAEQLSGQGQGILNRIEGALNFTKELINTQPIYAVANPQIPDRFKKIAEQNRNYLAHEYFNRDWHPMYFADMAKWLESAKVEFACSTHFIDHVDVLNFTEDQQKVLAGIQDSSFRQTVRDYMVNQQFRKDYWVKGPRKVDGLRQAELLRSLRIILVSHRPDIELKAQGARGEAGLNEPVYGPILNALADHKIKTLGELEAIVAPQGVNLVLIIQSIVILAGLGHVSSVQSDATIKAAQKQTQKLNQALILKSRATNDLNYLASPVTGGGITVGRFQQLFLMAIFQGRKQPAEWAALVWEVLAAQGQAIIKDGKTLVSPEENMQELTEQATIFQEKQLPILKALVII